MLWEKALEQLKMCIDEGVLSILAGPTGFIHGERIILLNAV